MNYSLLLKEELIAGAPRSACCKRAYLRGLFLDAAQTRERGIVLELSSAAARRECARVYREGYRREALMNRNTMLFASERLYKELTATAPSFSCPHCASHFLRGVMITAGSVTDPEKGYHLEIRLSDAENLPLLCETLLSADGGWQAKCRTTGRGVSLYFKNSTIIEEILTYLGANNALFALINAKIRHTIRNDENRATNCVTRNISKAVDASAQCREAIAAIRAAARFESLSAELRETAVLREVHPDASLSELSGYHNPPITKSGLNHRIRKIIAFAEALREKT